MAPTCGGGGGEDPAPHTRSLGRKRRVAAPQAGKRKRWMRYENGKEVICNCFYEHQLDAGGKRELRFEAFYDTDVTGITGSHVAIKRELLDFFWH